VTAHWPLLFALELGFDIDSDAIQELVKGNWPMLGHLDIETNNKITVRALHQTSASN